MAFPALDGIAGIDNEIEEDLMNLGWIGRDLRDRVRNIQVQRNAFGKRGLRDFKDLTRRKFRFENSRFCIKTARKTEQLPDHLGGAIGAALESLENSSIFRVVEFCGQNL